MLSFPAALAWRPRKLLCHHRSSIGVVGPVVPAGTSGILADVVCAHETT